MHETTPFESLADHLSAVGRSPEARDLAARLVIYETKGERPDLLEMLARRDADGGPAIRIIERLATEAPRDPLAAMALLHMLRRELERVRDALDRSERLSVLEAESDTLAAAWEVVTRRPPPGRSERTDAIWNLARQVSRIRHSSTELFELLPPDFDQAEPEREGSRVPPGLLAAAVAAQVLTPREVVLIARTRLEGWPLRAVARELGRPYDAARMERRRAEAALATFLRRYDSDGPS